MRSRRRMSHVYGSVPTNRIHRYNCICGDVTQNYYDCSRLGNNYIVNGGLCELKFLFSIDSNCSAF